MKKSGLFQAVSFISLFYSILWFPQCTSTSWVKKEVASINGEKILLEEFHQYLKKEIPSYDPELLARPEGWSAVKNEVLNRIIQERLLFQEAKKMGVTVTAQEKSAALSRLQSGYTQGEFEENLRERRKTFKTWEKEQEKKMILEKTTEKIISDHFPTEEELKKEFQKNRTHYTQPERSHCRQIVTTSREKAEKIISLLKQGENFAALAQQYSESPDRDQGGDLGFVARGELPPIMDDGCFRFSSGQTSGVVPSSYGFHIFRVIEKKPAKSLSFKEAQPLLLKNWVDKNSGKILTQWLEEKHQQAKIEIDEPTVQETPYPL